LKKKLKYLFIRIFDDDDKNIWSYFILHVYLYLLITILNGIVYYEKQASIFSFSFIKWSCVQLLLSIWQLSSSSLFSIPLGGNSFIFVKTQ